MTDQLLKEFDRRLCLYPQFRTRSSMKERAKHQVRKPQKSAKPPDIFEAARAGDAEAVRACLDSGADPAALNDNGFTALQCAAMGSNTTSVPKNLAVLKLLLEAGSPLEYVGRGGRTALYLAAEFAPTVDAVNLLLARGAKANICDDSGSHIVENAMMPAVKRLLSRITGQPVPSPPRQAKRRSMKMSPAHWRAAKAKLDVAFHALSEAGLIALQNAGTTQSDAFSDCSQRWHERGGKDAGLHGFCFYTGQDLRRAKETGELLLGFWGAPAGAERDMRRVGTLIVKTFQDTGFAVDWPGSGGERPTVYLRSGKSTRGRAKGD